MIGVKFEYIYGDDASSQYPNVRVSIETITPKTAKKMLETNVMNRKEKRETIIKDIERGRWKLNGASIVFSDEGVLLDGQNRLIACVETDTPIVSVIVRGVKADAQISMDIGVKRQVVDYLTMYGYKQASLVASIGAAMCRGEFLGTSSCFVKRNGSDFTVEDIVLFILDVYETRIEPIKEDVDNVARRYKGVSRGTLGSLFDRFSRIGYDDYKYFVKQLLGETEQKQPVRILVSKLLENMCRKQSKLNQQTIAAYIIKAWNAYMKGDEMKCLKYTLGGAHPESFPEIFEGWD